ncbi:MAG: type II secretion system protein M [Sterolibacterium sp.]|jgi:type II secretory pathway component PulM|nr:type II secretion system protein M [Sterolibacterium sp.]
MTSSSPSFLAPLLAWWQTRAPRERRFLASLALFLCVAVLLQGLWSAHQARQRLHQRLPQLQQQLDTLQKQAADLRTLQAQAITPPPAPTALLTTGSALLSNAGLPLQAGQLQAIGPRLLQLRAEVPFDTWIAAVGTLQRSAQLRLLRGQVEAIDGSPGRVRVDVQFALPESGTS